MPKPKLIGDKDRLLLREDQDRLLAFLDAQAADEPKKWETPRRVVRLILQSGLRASEVASLTVGDVDVKSRPYRLVVRGGKKRRADEAEEVVIPDSLARELRLWTEGRATDAPVIAHQNVFPYHRVSIWRFVKRAIEACDLNPKFSTHTLRHRFGTTMYQSSQDLLLTQRQLRHRSPEMATRYIHLAQAEEQMEDAVRGLDLDLGHSASMGRGPAKGRVSAPQVSRGRRGKRTPRKKR
jgi:integrase